MNELITPLLCVNGQLQLAFQRPRSRGESITLSSKGASIPAPPAGKGPARRTWKRTACLCGAGLALTAMAVYGLMFLWGWQRVEHSRERIRWSRQLQARELEIQKLARERQVLRGLLAVRAWEAANPAVVPAGYVVMPAPKKKQNL
jgi:hypothetical protein